MTDEQIIAEILEARQEELNNGVTDGAATHVAISGVVNLIHHQAFASIKCELEESEVGSEEEDFLIQVLDKGRQEANYYIHNVWDNYKRVQYLNQCFDAW